MNGHASLNRIYRLVWSQSRLAWVAVSEIGRYGGAASSAARIARAMAALGLVSTAALAAAPPPSQLPTGGSVVAGSAVISQAAGRMNVSQTSQRAIINWDTFNVGAQAQVNFNQPGSTAVILNRVLDTQASQIAGRITSNGQVILVNPNGVYFTKGSSVDVGALVATTHSISDSDFMAGRNVFSRNGATGSVVNEGTLTASPGGYIALLAPEVRNQGVIVARMGTVALASGETVSLQFDGSNALAGIVVTPSQIQSLVDNQWAVQAPGGRIILSAKAADRLLGGVVKNSGNLEAGGLVNDGGVIVLDSGENGTTRVSGAVDVSSAQGVGGRIEVTGDKVLVADGARLNASGGSGGGQIYVGGGWQGSGPTVRQATATVVEAGAILDASATNNGDGGTVVAWSDITNPLSATRAYGTFLARGGANGGNGGRIETSGHWLDVAGIMADASAPKGTGGTWLLDPYNLTISTSTTTAGVGGGSPDIFTAGSGGSNVLNTDIQTQLNNGTSVTLQTSGAAGDGLGNGDITVNASIAKTGGGDATLTLKAHNDIIVKDSVSITSSSNKLNLVLNSDSDANQSGAIALGNGSRISSNGGNIILGGGSDPTTTAAYGSSANPDGITGFNHANPGNGLGGSHLDAGGGNISVMGYASGGGIGVDFNVSGQLTTTGNGTIRINGGSSGIGVVLDRSVITAQNGDINIVGTTSGSGIALTYQSDVPGSVIKTTGSGAINITAGGQGFNFGPLQIGSNTEAGNISLTADQINFSGVTVQSTGSLTVKPYTAGTGIGIAGGAGTLQLPAAYFTSNFVSGFSGITVGSAAAGAITIGSAISLNGNATFQSGSAIAINGGSVTTTGSQTYSGAVSLGADTTLNTTNSAVTFGSTVDSQSSSIPYGLTANAGTGVVSFSGDIGRTAPLAGLGVTAGGGINIGGNIITAVPLVAGLSGAQYAGYYEYGYSVFSAAPISGPTTYTSIAWCGGDCGSNYSLRFTGFFKASATGTYTFSTISDDGSHLWVGSTGEGVAALESRAQSGATPVVSNGGAHGATERSGTIDLVAGKLYPILVYYGEIGGGDVLTVNFAAPGGALNSNGSGYYYQSGSSGAVGNQIFNGPVKLTSNSTLTTGGGVVSFNGTVNSDSTARSLTISGGSTTFAGVVGGTSPLASLTTGAVAINTPAITTVGNQSYGGPVTLGYADVGLPSNGSYANQTTLSSSSGSVNFASMLDSVDGTDRALFVSATRGTAVFSGVVGGVHQLGYLDVTGPTVLSANMTVGRAELNSAVTLANDLIVNQTGGYRLHFHSTVDGTYALTTNVASGAVFDDAIGGTSPLSSLSVTGNTWIGGNVTTSGLQSYAGNIHLNGHSVLTSTDGGAVTLTGTVNGAQSLTVNTSGTTTFGEAVGASTALTSLSINGSGDIVLGGNVTTRGAQGYSGAVTLGADTTLTTTNNDVGFGRTVDSDGTARALTINSGTGTTTFSGIVGGGIVPLASLMISGTGTTVLGGNVTTSGAQTYGGDVALQAADVTLKTTNGAVSIAGKVNSTGSYPVASTQSYLTNSTWTTTQDGSNPYQLLNVNLGQNWTYQADYKLNSLSPDGLNTIFSYGSYSDGVLLRTAPRGDGFYLQGTGVPVDLGFAAGSVPAGFVKIKLNYAFDGTNGTLNVYVDNVLKATQMAAGDLSPTNKILSIGSAYHRPVEGLDATIKNMSLVTTTQGGAALTIDSGAGAVTIAGGAANLSSLTIMSSSPVSSIGGVISGATSLSKQGSGILTLTGNNTYTGATTVSAGTLAISNASGLGSAAGATAVASGAVLDLQGVSIGAEPIVLNGGTLSASTGNASLAGAVTLGANSMVSVTGTQLTLSGVVSGNAYGLALVGTGAFNLSNTSNTLASIASGSSIASLALNNSTDLTVGSVTVGGNAYSRIGSVGPVTIANTAGLTLDAGIATTNGNIVLATTRLINNAGSGALRAGGSNTYWQVWSSNAAPFDATNGDVINGLANAYVQYGAIYGTSAVQGSGNGLLYTLAPTVTASLTGPISKQYDGTATATIAASNYSLSESINGDVLTLNNPVSGTYTSNGNGVSVEGVGTGKTVSVSGLTLSAVNGAKTVYGYALASGTIGNNIGTIGPAPLTVTANAAVKTYDAQAYSGGNGVSFAGFVNNETASVLAGAVIYGGTSQGAINAGRYIITPSGLSAANYSLGYVDAFLTVNKAPLTISSIDVSKTYDGTTNASGQARVVAGLLYGRDSLSGGSFAFADSAAGNNKAVLVSAVAINDGNGGGNYAVTLANNTSSTILQAPVLAPVVVPVVAPVPALAAAPAEVAAPTPAAAAVPAASGSSADAAASSSGAPASSGSAGGASDASASSSSAAASPGSSGSAGSSGSSTEVAAPVAKSATGKAADAVAGKAKADGKAKEGKGKEGSKLAGQKKDGSGAGGKGADRAKLAGHGRDGRSVDGKSRDGSAFADKGRGGGKFADKGKDGGAAFGRARTSGKTADAARIGRPVVARSAAAQARSVATASRLANRFASVNGGAPGAFNAGALAASYAGAAAAARRNLDPGSPMNRSLPPDSPAPIGTVRPAGAPLCDGLCSRSDANLAVAVQVQAQAAGTQAAPSDSLSESFHELPWRTNSGVNNVARSRAVANYSETLEEVNMMGTLNLFIIP